MSVKLVPFNCVDCGEPGLRTGGRGRPQLRCAPCRITYKNADRRAARGGDPPPRRCPTCDNPCDRGSGTTYCSPECRPPHKSHRYPERTCPVCGEQFTPSAARVRTCSRACGQILRQGDPTPEARATLRLSRDERERLRWQAKNRRRRALKRSAQAEPYTLAEIAARDKFRCQLCGRKVNMQIKAPHRKSPTIDHVIPIVENGDDTRANVQLAHRGCNSSKGARGSQQLALIG